MSIGAPDYGILSTKRQTITIVDSEVFDDSQTSYTSSSYDVRDFTNLCLYNNLDVTSTPTRLDIDVEFSDDDTAFYKLMNGPFANIRYGSDAGDRDEAIEGPLRTNFVRFKITATGTDATKKFTLLSKLFLS